MNGKNRENGSDRTNNVSGVLRPSGGYEQLKVYQLTTLIFDITVRFVELYIPGNSRTCDQMVQAARSGKQNIAEGSVDGATSAKLELNLYNVARGSLAELKNDYLDYLRSHQLPIWDRNHPLAQKFIAAKVSNRRQFRDFIREAQENCSVNYRSVPFKSVLVANASILLINVAMFWLRKMIVSKLEKFIDEGGFSENLYQARLKKRN